MILLDTHVLIWTAMEPERLSKAATAAIQDARSRGEIWISDITLWEIAWLLRHGRIRTEQTLESFVHDISLPVTSKPITATIATVAVDFPEEYPKDPADRLIGATSKVEGLPLITADSALRRCPLIHSIW